jgi:hypothetical protein
MDVEKAYPILNDVELPPAEKEGAERIVKALPAADLSMKELRIGHKKNERPIFGKTNPI